MPPKQPPMHGGGLHAVGHLHAEHLEKHTGHGQHMDGGDHTDHFGGHSVLHNDHKDYLVVHDTFALNAEFDQPEPPDTKEEAALRSLRLPFSMLRLVFQEITERLDLAMPLSQVEASTMAELSSQLQRLTELGGNSKDQEFTEAGEAPATTKNHVGFTHSVLDTVDFNDVVECIDVEHETQRDMAVKFLPWQENLVDVFKELDTDGSGNLSTNELRLALVAAGVPQARLTKILSLSDCDGNGSIDMSEWIRGVTATGGDHEEMRYVSEVLERKRTKDGQIFAEKKVDRFILNPLAKRRVFWDLIVSIMCLYIAVGLPFAVAFESVLKEDAVALMLIIDRIIDYTLLFDVLLNFRTGFMNGQGEIVLHPGAIARNYLKTWCLLDVLSSFPFEDISSGKMFDLTAAKLLKLGKLAKILKLMKPRNIDLAEVSDFLEDLVQSKLMQMVFRRGGVFIKMALLCHWMACGMKFVDQGFLTGYQDVVGSVWREYLSALYWSMTTLTTVGYGDITPVSDAERAYATVAMVVGGAFYGYIVGCITSTVANNDLNASAYYDRMDLIHAWLTHHRLPLNLKRTLRRYFKAFLSERSAVSEADIWHDLSPELQKDVGDFIIHENVKFNPIFDGLTIGTVVRLQSILQRVTILAGRSVTTKGESGTAMYIIVQGSVSMEEESANGHPTTKTLWPGQSFGEEILLQLSELYHYSVTALEKTKFEVLLEDEFLPLFQAMPHVMNKMRNNAIELNPKWGMPEKMHKGVLL